MQEQASLLLVTHVHVRQGPRGLQIDDQTAAGIEQWCRHFDHVTFYGILTQGSSSSAWVDTDGGLMGRRATIRALPNGYGAAAMARAYAGVRRELCDAIAAHRHLCFTLGLVIGDWPFVAALEAIRQKRRYSAWIDRVEAPILRQLAHGWRRRAMVEAIVPIGQLGVRHALRHSTVALLQGGDTFAAYARFAPEPHCTYDIHTQAHEQIAPAKVEAKQARARSGAPLEIVYLGRAAAMKGPFDWVDTLARLHGQGVPFRATWIGDGPDLPAIRQRVDALGLGALIDLPGFENRRDVLLGRLRDADLLLFCHKTPESARCLIEALVCGCPIVGYDSAYPRDLIARQGGGLFAAQNDVSALSGLVARLHHDRAALAELIGQAAASGTLYNEDIVYAHRAQLMKRA
ncbi:glycosyltransferase involved in cell wall biosynthesis [Novosphingobium chloroacetimidivorans]|uniref:Glycosyltransferase involved in cell wall biosynthesis n=1 Tax=Novosphingobium chloroacetimidivorans TaxID=1428314 RepID=A0A7W7K875_9SPHN|nr:glycosyltransferase [Novosphingobium chloroacetimidivorans]MBB4858062.1 glycosyltransferase involved in cell wall biosynthesis [Novosphingobium chloroacetimidivorans]